MATRPGGETEAPKRKTTETEHKYLLIVTVALDDGPQERCGRDLLAAIETLRMANERACGAAG